MRRMSRGIGCLLMCWLMLVSGMAQAQFGSDNFNAQTAGSNLTASTSAVGGSWASLAVGAHTGAFVFTGTPNAGRVRDNNTNASVDNIYILSATPPTADYSVQTDFIIVSSYPPGSNIGVVGRATGVGTDTFYWLVYSQGDGKLHLYSKVAGTSTDAATAVSFSPVSGHTYTFKLTMLGTTLHGYISDNGGAFVDEFGAVTSSTITGAGKGGIYAYFAIGGTSDTTGPVHLDNFSETAIALNTAIYADSMNWNYVGKWAASGTGATALKTCITSGNQANALLAGTTTCQLNFNVTNTSAGQYPDIVYQLDGGGWNRVTLDSTGLVTCTFPTFSGVTTSAYLNHSLNVITEGAFDAGAGSINIWGTNTARVQFAGVTLDSGGTLLASQINLNQLEFDGDSITDSVRLLGTGTFSQTLKGAHMGWAYQTAQQLNMAPVMAGYPGDGYVQTSSATTVTSSSVPLLGTAFASIFSGTAYSPTIKPAVVVVAGGTNDAAQAISGSVFQTAYSTYLTTIRTAYPNAVIECIVLPSFATYASNISAAVTAKADSRILYHSYGGQTFTTSDGTHFDVGGATKLASLLAPAIQSDLTALGIKLQGSAASLRPVKGGPVHK